MRSPASRARRPTALRWHAVVVLAAAVAAAPFVGTGCGTSATGVDACKKIEEARCRTAAAKCPQIQLTPPYYTSGSAVDACIRFYDTACLHGLEGTDPGPTQVQTCVVAIESGGCNTVLEPQTNPQCAFLLPPATVVEAGSDVDAGDAADATETSMDAMDAMDVEGDGDGFGL